MRLSFIIDSAQIDSLRFKQITYLSHLRWDI